MANALFGAPGGRHKALLDELASIYTDLHRHPELSMQEHRTAKIATDHVEALGYEVPLTENDPVATHRVAAALRAELGFCFVGGTDPVAYTQARQQRHSIRSPATTLPGLRP